MKRTAEQKRIREEKDRLDREQALQSQQVTRTDASAGIEKPQRKGVIDTGRSGGIGNAINIFNKAPENEPVAAVQRVCSPPFSRLSALTYLSKLKYSSRKSQSNCRNSQWLRVHRYSRSQKCNIMKKYLHR